MLLIVGVSLVTLPRAQRDGYGNGTKTCTASDEMIDADWSDLTEIQRTCAVTLVAFLAPARKFSMHEATEASFPEPITYPTVIYLHGCSGVWEDTYRRIDFLGENGFVLIVPLGFTRKKYPQSCETGNHREGMYSFDACTAIQKVKSLGWIVGKNVFLMGFSQGSITTATLQSDDPTSAVNARVVEGWACLADGDEYRGVNGPEEEPFLTLGGERDPWLSEYVNGGRLRKFPQYEVWKRVGSIPTGTTSKTS